MSELAEIKHGVQFRENDRKLATAGIYAQDREVEGWEHNYYYLTQRNHGKKMYND